MAQPDFQQLTASLTAATEQVSRIENLPAIDHGNNLLIAVHHMQGMLEAQQTELQAFRREMQGFRNEITRQMTVNEYNMTARLRNSQIRNRDTAFSDLHNQDGLAAPIFPQNLSALSTLRSIELTELLRWYGIDHGHATVDEKMRLFKLYIGFMDV